MPFPILPSVYKASFHPYPLSSARDMRLTSYRAVEILPPLKVYFLAIDDLRKSGLEWTVFQNGIFLDYFGLSALKSNLKPTPLVIDMANKVVATPGDGNAPVTFTYSFDLARFIVAASDLEKWEEESRVVGDEVTWNEFVALAEVCLGKRAKGRRYICQSLTGNRVEIRRLLR